MLGHLGGTGLGCGHSEPVNKYRHYYKKEKHFYLITGTDVVHSKWPSVLVYIFLSEGGINALSFIVLRWQPYSSISKNHDFAKESLNIWRGINLYHLSGKTTHITFYSIFSVFSIQNLVLLI